MKLGAENKKKAALAIALALVAVFMFGRILLSSPDSSTPPAAAPATPAASPQKPDAKVRRSRDNRARHVAAVWAPTLDPRLRLELLEHSEGLRYQGSGRNIFREHMEDIPRPVAPGLRPAAAKPQPWRPTAPPPPPPINLKFHGWASQAGEPKAVFLSQGADVFVAHEGDIVGRRYKVLRIGPHSVEIQDVLSNHTQTIPMAG